MAKYKRQIYKLAVNIAEYNILIENAEFLKKKLSIKIDGKNLSFSRIKELISKFLSEGRKVRRELDRKNKEYASFLQSARIKVNRLERELKYLRNLRQEIKKSISNAEISWDRTKLGSEKDRYKRMIRELTRKLESVEVSISKAENSKKILEHESRSRKREISKIESKLELIVRRGKILVKEKRSLEKKINKFDLEINQYRTLLHKDMSELESYVNTTDMSIPEITSFLGGKNLIFRMSGRRLNVDFTPEYKDRLIHRGR